MTRRGRGPSSVPEPRSPPRFAERTGLARHRPVTAPCDDGVAGDRNNPSQRQAGRASVKATTRHIGAVAATRSLSTVAQSRSISQANDWALSNEGVPRRARADATRAEVMNVNPSPLIQYSLMKRDTCGALRFAPPKTLTHQRSVGRGC